MVGAILQVVGLAALSVGCFLIAPAAGCIALGLGLMLWGLAIEKAGD